jgi:hypothetical protein
MRAALARRCEPIEADRRFHLSIAEEGGNSVLVGMVGTLFDGRHSPPSSPTRARIATVRSWQAALDEHEAILRALKARDSQAAAAAMCHHLESSHRRWIAESISSSAAPQRFRKKGGRSGAAWPPLFWPSDSAPNQTCLDGCEMEPAPSRWSSAAGSHRAQPSADRPWCPSG